MKWILYGILASSLAGGALWASTRTTDAEPSQEQQEEELEDFVPSEEVPAGSSISFPVDI